MNQHLRHELAFVDRNPSATEIERLRLVLSTFQDGSGMLSPQMPPWAKRNNALTLPGWRDFERSVAWVFGGTATESKYIYDVLLHSSVPVDRTYGLSCKMRGEYIRKAVKANRGSIELANAAGEFWDKIKSQTGLDETTYINAPEEVGRSLFSTVEDWHARVDVAHGGVVQVEGNSLLNLLWEQREGMYQLFQFPIHLPDPSTLLWQVRGRHLEAFDGTGTIIEWYPFSGGQLKFYPTMETSIWNSDPFRLEPLPSNLGEVVMDKAASYFGSKWADATW